MLNIIKRRNAEDKLMAAHVAAMANADKDAWTQYKQSLGFEAYNNEAASLGDVRTDLEGLKRLKATMGGGL